MPLLTSNVRAIKNMKSILFTFLFSFVYNCLADDMANYMRDTDDLINMGEYEEALERTIWFHDHALEHDKSMSGVRLSFALSDWYELGKKYPPALVALKNIRDKNKNILLSGNGTFQNFMDLSSFNETLGEEKKTLEVFLFLDKNHPEQAKRYYHVIDDYLIENQEFELCSKYISDAIYDFERLRHKRELSISFSRTTPEMKNELRDIDDKFYTEGVLGLIKILMASDRESEAKEVQKRALAYYDNQAIRDAIQNSPNK